MHPFARIWEWDESIPKEHQRTMDLTALKVGRSLDSVLAPSTTKHQNDKHIVTIHVSKNCLLIARMQQPIAFHNQNTPAYLGDIKHLLLFPQTKS